MNVRNLLSDQNGGSTIAFEGLCRPWPEFPIPVPHRQVSQDRTVRGFNSGTQQTIPGKRIIWDQGMADADADLTIKVPGMTAGILQQVLTLQAQYPAPVQYSADNLTSVYLCSWTENPIEITPRAGFSDTLLANTEDGLFDVTIHLYVLGRII